MVEDGQVELAQARGVSEDVEDDDLPAPDREGADRERLAVPGRDFSWGAVDEDTMRVFVAGARGAIGTRLVPPLTEHGHEVIGTCRSPGNAERVRALGAEPVALDLLDARAVRTAMLETEPEAIVHQATALADVRFSKNMDHAFAPTNRLRIEGTDALPAAA